MRILGDNRGNPLQIDEMSLKNRRCVITATAQQQRATIGLIDARFEDVMQNQKSPGIISLDRSPALTPRELVKHDLMRDNAPIYSAASRPTWRHLRRRGTMR
jgi:hypothetical protein